MTTYITLINPFNIDKDNRAVSIEIDNDKRILYEEELYELYSPGIQGMMTIISKNGKKFYLSREIANKYLIKIEVENI
jgi:hypothetical protein